LRRLSAGARRHGQANAAEGRNHSEILSKDRIDRSLRRISHEILERNASSLEGLALVGVLTRGAPLARRIAENVRHFEGLEVPVGALDITLHRDDREERGEYPEVRGSHVPFDVTGKTVVLIDDVLYTGRTARAAMDALLELGRPAAIRLAILVDRGHRELPIRADHVGKNVPTSQDESVRVRLVETDGEDGVIRVAD
jgi:pyrimidine operon attenuation protein / uracil phosphoribosyltransferase